MTTEDYLKDHGLDPEFVQSKLGWQWDDKRITIPHYDQDGKLLHCRYRNMNNDPKFQADPGSHVTLYGAWRIDKDEQVLFCEGEPDAAKLIQEGFAAVTAGGVKTFSAKIATPLTGKRVVIILDNDTAGQSSVPKYCDILQRVGATPFIARLPDTAKDICEYFADGASRTDMQEIINSACDFATWQEQNKPKEYAVVTGEDIMQRTLPEQEWYIKRMVPIEGLTFLIGPEGVGKSFYALTLGNAIATDEKWLNTFSVSQTAQVLFLDKENTMSGIQRRMKGLGITGKGLYFLEYPEYFDFHDDSQPDKISEFAKYIQGFVQKHDIGVVVIDSFIDFMVGSENSAEDTQGFFNCLKRLLPNKSIIIIHHEGKPTQGVTRTSSHKARGSTNIMAQAFSAFSISQLPRTENMFAVEQTKLRGAQKIKKFKVEMEIHTDMYDKDKTDVIGLRYKGEIYDQEEKSLQAEEIIREALNTTGEVSRKELEDICVAQNISIRTFQDAIKRLKDEKIIESVQDKNNWRQKTIRLI